MQYREELSSNESKRTAKQNYASDVRKLKGTVNCIALKQPFASMLVDSYHGFW